MRSLVDRARFPSHPFTRQPLPRRRQSGVGPSAALPAELRSALRLSSATTERCVSPASANQPAITSTRGVRSISSARLPARTGKLVPGSARPEAETSSWDPREGGVKRRLTAHLPLRSAPARSPRRSEDRAPLGTVLPEGRFESARRLDGVFGRPRGEGELPLTRSVAPDLGGAFAFPRPEAAHPFGRPAREPGPLPPLLSSKRASHFGPARLSTGRTDPRRPACAGAFRRRSPASCNRNDPRARPQEPTGTRPRCARLPSCARDGRLRSRERRRPAIHGPGGR
jgi:hypothetical protein